MDPDPDVVTSVREPRVSSVCLAGGVVRDPVDAPPSETLIEVIYPVGRGAIGIRGSHAPLSWEHTEEPKQRSGDAHLFKIPLSTEDLLEFKVVRGDDWAAGRNYVVHAGDHIRVEPYFEGTKPTFHHAIDIDDGKGGHVTVDVVLPPSYEEQQGKRYPVLYVLDGQSLWEHSSDPFGSWGLDGTMEFLYELGAIDELVVIGIHTAAERIDQLTPVPDVHYGGGKGAEFLDLVAGPIRDFVNTAYRTLTERSCTGILGSSLGGLFAFYAAWSKPEIFGKAACLSSSFWWANRWAVRLAQTSTPPSPRPYIYLDSGVNPSPMDEDVRLMDGFHHTRSMHRALTKAGFDIGAEVHRLVFPGQAHQAASWASRVALPLQLLVPRVQLAVDEERWAERAATSFEGPSGERLGSA